MINATASYPFLRGEQVMAARIRSYDWSKTSLGDFSEWPESLRTAVSICLNSNNPVLIVWGDEYAQLYNDAYGELIGDKKTSALGTPSADTWPEAWHVIQPLLDRVCKQGETVNVEDQLFPIDRHGYMENTYFTTTFMPLYNDEAICGAFIISHETTEKFLRDKRVLETEKYVRDAFMQAPMGIATLEGDDMRISLANDEMLRLWRRDQSVIGSDLLDALPELKGQEFPGLLKTVYETGEAYYAYEKYAQLLHDNKLNDHYFNFVYAPLKQDEKTTGVMAVAYEVTAQVNAKKQLVESEKRFKSLILEAPMATALYTGKEMRIEVANEAMLNLWGKEKTVIGQTLKDALPELEGQPFLQLLENVFTTGKAYHTDMQSADLVVDGKLQRFWFNFTYKPLHDTNGAVYGILNMAVDISKQVHLQEQKDEFLAIASHELKTPVTSIKAYAQVLQNIMKENSNVQEAGMLMRMDNQINKLTNLIENLLDVTKIQAGKLEFNEVKFEFNTMVKEVVTDMQAILPAHTIELHTTDDAVVFADRERIEQVVNNLITNAAKYSPNANRIIVRCYKKDGTICCAIEDKGIGINAENLTNIFDRFYQVSGKNNYRFTGLGLGLYISAEIIRRSNGDIHVESKEGEGSTFSFCLNILNP